MLKVLDLHQAAAAGQAIDAEELHRTVAEARIWDNGDMLYRPLTASETSEVEEQMLDKYTNWRNDRLNRDQSTEGSSVPDDPDDGSPRLDAIQQQSSFEQFLHATSNDSSTRELNAAPQSSARERSSQGLGALRPRLRPGLRETGVAYRPDRASLHGTRSLHTVRRLRQQAALAAQVDNLPPPDVQNHELSYQKSDIRARLRQWQEVHGNTAEANQIETAFDNDSDSGSILNPYTRLPEHGSSAAVNVDGEDEEREAQAHLMRSQPEDLDTTFDTRILQMGDLVELEYTMQDRESIVAVFVRRYSGKQAQFLTMNGRWVFANDRLIPYSIPGWVSPKLVEPILEHLPSLEQLEEYIDVNGSEKQEIEDLSIPREVTAPLVTRMVQFWNESREIYRRHASVLDNAHSYLAEEQDLRYGTLMAVAKTLLQTPADEVPVTALFTVRNALTRAGFAFNIDRRSHRLTGYLQIRSKEQVRMVDNIRTWIRDWQDDKAKRAALQSAGNEAALRKLKTPNTAKYVYSFVDKARTIVLESRKSRMPTESKNISPSNKSYAITKDEDCVKVVTEADFTSQEQEIVRFFEAWAGSGLLTGLPRLLALPPLILQATGLYEDYNLTQSTGWMFLQELGTIMPFENRVRFDHQLLLPTSQHSVPLQSLMTSLLKMRSRPDFNDSMHDLRRDWGDTPVYCIDEASAQEIDDGISVEKAEDGLWWIHVHVANPTAFFARDHPAAKMARHMGETLYMPERTYTMLPKWATSRHFSLGKNRPCLTFSLKLNSTGEIREHKIVPGIIRNTIALTRDEVQSLIGLTGVENEQKIAITVGGQPPARKERRSMMSTVTAEQIKQLKTLHMLAENRASFRRANGGVFFNIAKPDVEVWQTHDMPGLAWDHPHRLGRRVVEGDPILRMHTHKMYNYFSSAASPAQTLVTECMLAAGEVAAKWCAERQIPTIYRGTVRRPDNIDPDVFYRNVLEPATKKSPTGERPLLLGLEYVKLIGAGAMRTEPLHHGTLGLSHFGKVTSPLRRYGDMILHWQIEAALREEARTGQSLVTNDKNVSRNFLPFSREVLETIMIGLQPREAMITRSKQYSLFYWVAMVMFRAFHYNECELPFRTPKHPDKPPMTVFLHAGGDGDPRYEQSSTGTGIELNIPVAMLPCEKFGLPRAMAGDTWEVDVEHVDVYRRLTVVKPVKLIYRTG